MLAENWGEPWPAAMRVWTEARDELLDRYRGADGAGQLDELFRLADALGTTDVIVEAPFVDFDYRSEYSQHHSRRFRPPPDTNERLLFRASGRLVGSSVMRPISKPVGRTLMAIPEPLDHLISVSAAEVVRAYGEAHEVRGFPFVSQDSEYARCAHAAIWSIARWAHIEHGLARHSMAEVVLASGAGQRPDRTVVSGGLNMQEVANAFRRLGLPVLSYTPTPWEGSSTFETTMQIYLDSGIPVAINTPKHLTVLVGYAIREDGRVEWIRSDDNSGPYQLARRWNAKECEDELGSWQRALVPLPGRIHVPAEVAEVGVKKALLKQLQAEGGPAHLLKPFLAGELRFRTRALRPAHHKVGIATDTSMPDDVKAYRIAAPTGQWAYLTEISEGPDAGILGTVMMDATGEKLRPAPLVADIDGWCVRWDRLGNAQAERLAPAGTRYESRLPNRRWTSAAKSILDPTG